jgi:Zn-dependent protease
MAQGDTGKNRLSHTARSASIHNPGFMTLSDPQQISSNNGDRFIAHSPEPEPDYVTFKVKPRYWLAGGLLLATVFTTLLAGAQLQSDFVNNQPMFAFSQGILPISWIWQQPSRLLLGIPFSATLMLILLSHEMGHFVACKRYGVDATLPYFIPAPTLIGTLGAFIRIRSPFPSRAALFDIGIAGPIAGFLVALPALVAGLALSKISPTLVSASEFPLGHPAVLYLVRLGEGIRWPMSSIYLHPVAVAGWVGMFATALNLLPGAQLDGGHIFYAVWPRGHRYVTRILAVALLVMGLSLWVGWLLWFGLLLAFGGFHPYVREHPGLNRERKWLAVFALLMFALTFMAAPFPGKTIDWHKAREAADAVRGWFR